MPFFLRPSTIEITDEIKKVLLKCQEHYEACTSLGVDVSLMNEKSIDETGLKPALVAIIERIVGKNLSIFKRSLFIT